LTASAAHDKEASAPLHFLKAQVCDAERNAGCAETELRAALEADARYLPAYFALGALYFNTNQQDRALAEYKAASEKRTDNTQAFVMMGLLEAARGNYDAATEQYKRALALDAVSPIANNNLAMIYADHGKGNLDEAVRMAQGLVQRTPNEPNFADTLGWVYYRKGLYPAAIEQLQKAVAKATSNNTDSAAFRYHLGVALAAQGDKTRARTELQQAVQLADKHPFKQLDDAKRALANL
jgi:tetratricopeptide (TPR) repeat protein